MTPREKRAFERDQKKQDESGGGSGGPSSKKSRRDSPGKRNGGSSSNAGSTRAAAKDQSCTDSNGMDPHVEIYDLDKYMQSRYSTKQCNVEIQFCDESRNVKQKFSPADNIYMLLTFFNPTKKDVYAEVHGGGLKNIALGRGGVEITIRGIPRGYTPTPEHGKDRNVKIGPNKSYNFFRLFCASRSSDYKFYGCWTPKEAGKYDAVVSCPLEHGKPHELGSREFEII